MSLNGVKDVHTHRQDAGEDAIVNLPLGAPVPQSKGMFSVGIHPWETDRVTSADWEWLERTAKDERVVAIGEAGLDKLRGAPLDVQEEIFKRHIQLSEALGKALIVHCVRCQQRIIELRKQMHAKQQWIYHGFRGNAQSALQLLRAGIDISIGEKYNPEVLEAVPADHLYHETD